ncbi:M48 family metallopeptidase [Aliiruegeria sabulilitoris]|uniref:M48 family metallopeptidase n=1 Tax=Aliiruegeria sabulilitoris TaxID=1510458 RepID=UPI00082D2F57|nr:SprT family zinc-dependent metalloprotease [Aliiruegeria sabulilitoris]NDR58979.1 M48 family metallopeptidase [Pseudoruegeria sp. M32A2M]
MSEHVLEGDPPVRLVLRRSTRARRYSLRVSRLDGRVTLTMPKNASQARALEFAQEKAAWIQTRLADRPSEVLADVGASLPVDGRQMRIEAGLRNHLDMEGARIVVSQRSKFAPAAVSGLLRALARERLAAASDHFAEGVGRDYSRITLRDTRSRWGSCSSAGALMYSWRLILAPPEVLRYVAAHEVAHLVEMNHGPRFWAKVGRLYPGYEAQRQWLRRHGETLHRYRFTEQAD